MEYVVWHWSQFSDFTYTPWGDIYPDPISYRREMSKPSVYGTSCELKAAADIYPFVFEVYFQGRLIAQFGTRGLGVKRLKFSGEFQNGHYDVMVPRDYFKRYLNK